MTKLTQQEFEDRIYNLVGNEYKATGNYKNTKTPVEIKHMVCGKTSKYQPNNFFHGSRCSYCRIKNQTKTNDWFLNKVKELKGNEYTPLSEYIVSKKKVKMRHNLCGYIWYVTPDNFFRRQSGCPKCSKNARINTDTYKKEIKNILGEEYEVIGTYINARTKVKFLHHKCGNMWEVVPYAIKEGTRCPFCKSSKGERYIIGLLKKYNIEFEIQKMFDGCKDKNPLRFDLYLPESNTCIEYDGIQHFEPVDFANKGEKWAMHHYEETKRRDEIKNVYCHKNTITLIRIPYYTEYKDIDNIIKSIINTNEK